MAREVVTEHDHACVGERVSLDAVLTCVAMLPRPVTLFVEGTSIVPEVTSLLARQQLDPGRRDLSGTIWPRSKRFHVAVTDPLMKELQRLGEKLAEPEIADHLVAYDASGRVQLAAYDAGSNEIWVAREVPASVMQQITALADS